MNKPTLEFDDSIALFQYGGDIGYNSMLYDFNNIKDINKGYYYIDIVDINIFDYDLECSLSICFEDGKFNMCVDR